MNEKDECLLDKVKEVEHLKCLDSSMDYAKQLKMLENQVVQLKTTVKEMKRIIEEKDFAYGQSASQIQVLESQVVFLRAKVERVHKILDEGPSASTSVKECLNCAKMQESQKKLEKLIDSQKVCKEKAGIGYSPSIEKAKGKAIVKEMNIAEKKNNLLKNSITTV